MQYIDHFIRCKNQNISDPINNDETTKMKGPIKINPIDEDDTTKPTEEKIMTTESAARPIQVARGILNTLFLPVMVMAKMAMVK